MMFTKDQLVVKLVPEKLRMKYTDFEVVAETSYYKIFQATSVLNLRRYSIRIFDLDSSFAKTDINDAATLFLQEILCLCLRLGKPDSSVVRIEDFAINTELNQIGFVLPAQRSLQDILSDCEVSRQQPDLNVERLLKDVSSDLDFIYNRLKLHAPKVSPETIFYLKDLDSFFLGDWASAQTSNKFLPEDGLRSHSSEISLPKMKAIQSSKSMPLPETEKLVIASDYPKKKGAENIFNLGLIGLEACGIDKTLLSSLSDMKSSDIEHKNKLDTLSNELCKLRQSELVRSTIIQMLHKDPAVRISLDDVTNGRWRKIYIAWSSFGTNRVGFEDIRSREAFEMQGAQLEWGGILNSYCDSGLMEVINNRWIFIDSEDTANKISYLYKLIYK